MNLYFPDSYEDSRARFLQSLSPIQQKWHSTQLEAHPLKDHPDLTIDWLWAHAKEKKTLLIISTAEHGIEGYVGAAMLKLFIEEFTPRLNPENTGLLLIHGLNPWGMKHHRKVNKHNVDLNRNFVFDGIFDPAINPEFLRVADFINPQRRLESFSLENIRFWGNVVKHIFISGIPTITTAALLGQHHTPYGFYHGGTDYQESTRVAMNLYRRALAEYDSVIQIDIHTGYGPRDQMSIIVPPLDLAYLRRTLRKIQLSARAKDQRRGVLRHQRRHGRILLPPEGSGFSRQTPLRLRIRIRHVRRFAPGAHPQSAGDGLREPTPLARRAIISRSRNNQKKPEITVEFRQGNLSVFVKY
jgi:hypothetical protein